ncbi:hypothetical protein ABH926_004073 [Catenulispora sp. GP43]|uniref:WD40 repeat domain-containing protein n=1 Tax=Catenulispora sp. GP43 TaxID=3156263 RepID=UPI003519BAE9
MAAGGGPAAPSTVLPAGRGGVCRAVVGWLTEPAAERDAARVPRLLLVTGPRGAGKTFTLAWASSELAVLAEAADDERFAWVSARGLTPRVLAWQLAGQLGVAVADTAALAPALAARLRGSGSETGEDSGKSGGSGFGPGIADGVAADGLSTGAAGGLSGAAGGGAAGGRPAGRDADADAGAEADAAAGGSAAGGSVADGSAADGHPGASASASASAGAGAGAGAGASARSRVPGSRSATWDLSAGVAEPLHEAGRWSRVTILISELDLAGHLRDGSAREAVLAQLIAPLLAVPGVRLIVESAHADVVDVAARADSSATVIDLGEHRWTDRAEFAAWLDDLVPSGGAAAPQAYPNPTKAREILSLASKRHAGLLAASDERPWKLAAVPFDVAFREGIADQIVLEPANLVLVQQPALSTAIDALGSAVAPGTRAAWRVAGQALTNSTTVPERAAILHGAALAVGDHALAEAVAPYTRGTRPSDGAPVGDPIPWLTRWAGWRPLPPDTPRPTPWPGPVAALAVAAAGVAQATPTIAGLAAAGGPGAGSQVPGPLVAGLAAVGGPDAGSQVAAPHNAAGSAVASAAGSPAAGSAPSAGAHGPTVTVPAPAAAPVAEAAEPAHAGPGILLTPVAASPAGAWLPDPEPTPPEVLVAIDDLARAYRLDPRSGRIVGRPASPVMVKARAAAVVDASPSLVLTDSSRRLAALGPTAPRKAVAAVRDVLPDTAVTAVAVARDALVFGAGDGRVHVWDVDTEELIADPEDQHSGVVTAVSAIWMPDMDVLFALSGGQDGTFRLWAVPADAGLLPVEDRGVPVTAVTAALTEVGPVAAVAWADGCVTVWDLAEARTGRPIPLGWAPKALALAGDGLLIAAGDDGLIAIDLHLGDFFED